MTENITLNHKLIHETKEKNHPVNIKTKSIFLSKTIVINDAIAFAVIPTDQITQKPLQ